MPTENKQASELEELLERSVIKLPKPLDLQHAEDLLHFITARLPGRVDYKISQHKRIGQDVEKSLGYVRLKGTISSSSSTHAFTSFSSSSRSDPTYDPTYIEELRFDTIPGYSLREHRTEQVELWDRVRNLVQGYFED